MSAATPALTEALKLAATGLRLFPLRPGEKKPAIKEWPEKATADADTLRAWAAQFPGCNFGLATGRGIVAVDVDRKNGTDGAKTLRALLAEHGAADLPESWAARTPTDGLHLVFRVPEGAAVGNSAGKLGPGVDARGDNGYIVAAGSKLPGGVYRWEKGYGPDDRPEPAPCPGWLLERLARDSRSAAKAGPAPAVEPDRPDTLELARHYLEHEAPEAVEGAGGNDATYRVAAKLRGLGLTEPAALDVLLEPGGWNETKAAPPWSPDELAAGPVASAFRYGQNAPGAEHPAAAFADAPLPEGAEAGDDLTAPTPPVPYPISRADRMPLHLTEPDLVEGIVGPGDVWAFVGASTAGKSFLLLYLFFCMSTGRLFFGRRVQQGATVLVVYEGRHRFARRIAALCKLLGHIGPLHIYVVHAATPNLRSARDHLRIAATIGQAKKESGLPVLAVGLDTYAQSVAGIDENAAGPVQESMTKAAEIARATGASVVFTHHVGKAAEKGARGSSAFYGALDAELTVTRSGGVRSIKASKVRDGEDGAVLGVFRLRYQVLGDGPYEKPVGSVAVEPLDDAAGRAFERPALTPDAATVLTALREAVATEGKPLSDEEVASADDIFSGPVVHEDRWRTLAVSALASEKRKPDTAERAFRRQRTWLRTNRYVQESQGWCGIAP